MNAFKKLLVLGLALCMTIGVGFSIVSCGHEHTFSDAWTSDENKHWHEATCEHTDERKDEADHDFDANGKCTVCQYQKQTEHEHTFSDAWSSNETMHWHAATCEGHESVKKDEEAHDFDENGKCTVCQYQKQAEHEHTFSDVWSSNETMHWHAATCEGHESVKKDEEAHVFDENGKCTICDYQSTVEPETVTYTVTVKIGDEAVVGLMVTLTGTDGVPHMAMTNENGDAVYELEAGEYTVTIDPAQTTFPSGYVLEQESYTATEAASSVTVSLIPDPTMMDFSIQVLYANGAPVVGLTVALHRQSFDIATASAKTDDTGTAVIRAPQGVYEIRLPDCPANYGYQEGLIVETTAPNLPDAQLNLPAITLTELGTELYNRIPVKEGTYTVTVTAERKSFFYEFHPSKEGYYRITSAGTYAEDGETKQVDTWLKQYAGVATFMNETPIGEMDNVSGDNVHFDYRFLIFDEDPNPSDGDKQSYLENNIFAFEIGAYATLFGTDTRTFTFTITYDGDYTPPTKKTVEPEAQEVSDVPYTAPAETVFTWLHYSQYDQIVYNATDKFYHFGSENGPVVLAAIGTSKIPQGLDASLSSAMARAGIDKAVTWSTGIPDENNVVTSYDCRKFIDAYIAAADKADGYHPLTEELKKFLAHYTVMHGAASMAWDIDNHHEGAYLFACGYFKSNYESTLSGTGSEEDAYIMGSYGEYRVDLVANTPVWFATRTGGCVTFEGTNVTLTFNGQTYQNTANIPFDASYSKFSFTATENVANFVFTFSPARGSQENPIPLNEGSNTVEATEALTDEGVWYSFTASTTMLYKIYSLNTDAIITSPDGLFDTLEQGESAIFEADRGETYYFTFGYEFGAELQNFTVTIERTAAHTTAGGNGSESDPYLISETGWYIVTTRNQNGEWGEHFAFNARIAGKWRLTFFHRQASIIYRQPNDNEGVSYSLADDEAKASINIEATELTIGVHKFFMGANMGGDYGTNEEITYYFYFEEIADTPTPPPVGGNTLVVGENAITISDSDAEEGVPYTFTAPEAATYTFTVNGEGYVTYVDENDISYNKIDGESFDVDMAAGQTITLTCASYAIDDNWNPIGCTYTIKVEKKESGGGETPPPAGNILTLGANTIVTGAYGAFYTFTATEAGNYTFSCTDVSASVTREVEGESNPAFLVPKDGATSETFALAANEVVTLWCANVDFFGGSTTFILTITKA